MQQLVCVDCGDVEPRTDQYSESNFRRRHQQLHNVPYSQIHTLTLVFTTPKDSSLFIGSILDVVTEFDKRVRGAEGPKEHLQAAGAEGSEDPW